MVKNQVLICAEGFFLQKEKNKAINSLYPFQTDASFFIPLKTSESHIFQCFQGGKWELWPYMGSAGNSYSDLSKIYSKDFESEKINSDKKSISKKYS